jgi:DNA-binding response OmpR family regulator
VEPLRVLVVDDEEELVDALVERLNMRGIHADGVTTGKAALEYLRDSDCDVVLLDVKMPSPGGLEVLREMKRHQADREVILLTGHGSAQDAKLGMGLGAFDYVMKPVNIEELMVLLLKAGQRREPDGR